MTELHSFKDDNGKWWIACNECRHGGNGSRSCGTGAKIKRWKCLGCFGGRLLPGYVEAQTATTSETENKGEG